MISYNLDFELNGSKMVKFIISFLISFVITLTFSRQNSPCENNGILKSNQGNCFCDGTQHYGEKCELPCVFGERNEYQHIIPEKCLDRPCVEVPSPCIDINLDLTIDRGYNIDRKKYPVCRISSEFCMDLQNNFYRKEPLKTCENGGIMKTLNHTSKCMCKGTKHFGDYCEKHCDDLGIIIPEKCLNGPCPLPSSCIDLGRENIVIDRCKNGGILTVGKTESTCFCHGTGFWGEFCERRCFSEQPGYCKENPCPDIFPTECIF